MSAEHVDIRATMRRWPITLMVCGALVAIASCSAGNVERSSSDRALESTLPYAPGSWRLTPHELADVVLTTSHILIRHIGTEPHSALRAPGWMLEPQSKRSRPEAIVLAQSIARKAQSTPESFASLARAYSEDITTRDTGGSLGTWSAQLMFPEFLDAISVMQVGQVSNVIETTMGLHVILLRETPKEQLLAADEIVVGYATASMLKPAAGRSVQRSRQEALEIALAVARQAKAGDKPFAALVHTHSDHETALKGGDIGTWSTHEPFIYHREIEAIAALQVGEVSEPIDSALGFRIFRRKPAGSRSTPPRAYRAEIPRPTDIDVDYMVRNAMSPEMAAGYVYELSQTIDASDMALNGAQSEAVRRTFARLEADMLDIAPEARVAGLNRFREELKHILGAERFAAFQNRIRTRLRAQVAPDLAN